MPRWVKGIDLSFSRVPPGWVAKRQAKGFQVFAACLWTGGLAGNDGIKAVAENNLRAFREAGVLYMGYANASPPNWWPLSVQMEHIIENAGAEWGPLRRIAIDLEIAGLTYERALELGDTINGHGKETEIAYSAAWFWNGHMGGTTDPRWRQRFPWIWPADYDGDPRVETTRLFGPWTLADVVGKQYQGTTSLDGVQVDLNIFDLDLFKPEAAPTPAPPPDREEAIMGAIKDAFAKAGEIVEQALAAVPRGERGEQGLPGRDGAPGPAGGTSTPTGGRCDTLRAEDGHATGFAARNGISLAQLKALNPNGPPSGDWNLVHPGELYRVG